MMPIRDRAAAIGRAQQALRALGDRPGATREQLGQARERLNDCYRLNTSAEVWAAVNSLEDHRTQHGSQEP